MQGVTALSRAGVQFTDAQKEAIKALVETNRVADAQAIVLKELETQMGGAARAARDTLGGAIEGLKNTFDNLLEGESGSEGVQGTRQAIEDLTDTLNDPAVKQGIDDTAQGLLKITNAAVQLIAKLGDAGSALREYFADASEQSDASIQNRINELETEVFQIERQNRNSLPIFQRDTSDQKAEIAELQRIQSARNRAEMFSGVRSSIDSTEFAKGGGGSGADKRTKAVKELTEAQKAFNDQEEVYALLVEESAAATRELFFDRQRADEAAAEAARERLADNKALIGSMQEELTLLRSSASEQERRIALSQLSADATDEHKRAVAGLADELHKTREQISIMDSFRGTLSDTFADYITGAKTAKEATRDFFSSLLEQAARALTDQAVQVLLGSFGTASGGAAGGGWAALIGSLFGGGRASGGPVSGNKLYEVGENGRPELFQQGGRTYLIPGNSGVVNPIAPTPGQASGRAPGGGGGITFNQEITVNSDGVASTSTTTNDQSAFAKAFGDRMRQVAQAEIIQQLQPGGLLYSGRPR